MKKTILLIMLILAAYVGNAQEWFTSMEVAKRLAMVQDKMLFVMWEGALQEEFPVILRMENGESIMADLTRDENINSLIWQYFVPVKIPEYQYQELSENIKETRGIKYFNTLIDDGIKIMDINGNILNTSDSQNYYIVGDSYYLIFTDFIKRYALNTSFLKMELKNYYESKNFTTTFRLASKYLDFAIFAEKNLRPEIVTLSNIYFDEVRVYLEDESLENRMALYQKLELLKVKEALILGNPKKASRILRRIEKENIDESNNTLDVFLNYTTLMLLNKYQNAKLLESKVSSVNIKMAEIILNNYKSGKDH